LGTSDVVADMAILGTSDVVADMAILATTDVVADMNTLATSDIVSDLNTLASSAIVDDLNILATSANVTNMATLGASGVVGNIATVSGIASNVSTVSGISSNITTVAGAASAVSTVASAIANVNTTASNIAGVNSFAERYRVASSAPSSDLDEGDLYYNTSNNTLYYYNGSAWTGIASYSVGDGGLTQNNFTNTLKTKLDGIEASADVTDATNVTAAGALMDSEVTNLAAVKAFAASDYATAAQGTLAAAALPKAGGTMTGSAHGSTDTDTSNTGSVTLNFTTNQNFVLTLTGNVTLANPTTETVGQSGFITFIQDGTGSRTVSLGTDFETAGAAGLTLTSTASATDIVPYVVVASGRILLGTPQLAFA